MPAPEYAVFTEFSPASKLMVGGWNTRVFTDADAQRGAAICCDFTTGIVTLAQGIYHISGFSMVAYNSGGEPPEMATIRIPAAGGYCRLRTRDPQRLVKQSDLRSLGNEDPSIICVGCPSTPNLSPSLFEAYFETEQEAQILLEHQSGMNPDRTYLRVYIENSKWHAMARICIRQM
jgi:hypothetical protein